MPRLRKKRQQQTYGDILCDKRLGKWQKPKIRNFSKGDMTVIQFKSTFEYKLIYVMRINDKEHNGLLKIGDATVKTDKSEKELVPNCKELNSSAKERIKSYTQTASISYDLLHTELAIRTVTKKGRSTIKAFRDNAVHDVLIMSGIPRHVFDMESQGKEWFKKDL